MVGYRADSNSRYRQGITRRVCVIHEGLIKHKRLAVRFSKSASLPHWHSMAY